MGLPRPIRDQNGNTYLNAREAARKLKLRANHITEICKRSSTRQSTGGFIFGYLDETPPSPQSIEKHREKQRCYQMSIPERTKEYRQRYLSKPEAREKIRKAKNLWTKENPEKVKRQALKTRLKNLYGMTIEEYEKILIKQENKCAICLNTVAVLRVDHDHKTQKIRGLLCNKCNLGLGLFDDGEESLENAIKYLRKIHD